MADQMKPTPRSTILGLFSDVVNLPLEYMSSPERTQQMQGAAQFLYGTGIPKTLERMSYGDSLFTGSGMTLRPREETINAAMNVAPFAPVAGRVAGRMIKATEGMPVGMSIKDVGKGIFEDATKYHQKVPEIKSINVNKLKRMNAGEVADVSDEVAAKMDFSKPIQVSVFSDGELRIVDGHHRVAAAKKLGIQSLPVELQAINAKGATLNKLAQEATYPQQAALPTQYPLAPAGTRYEEFGGDLTYMTPDEFLQQVRPLQLDAESLDNIAALRSHVESGGKLDPLHIYASGKEDGRHRAYLAKELGIEKVPVALHGQTPTPIETPPTYSDPFGNTIGSSIR